MRLLDYQGSFIASGDGIDNLIKRGVLDYQGVRL